jgi:hypothetical protein
MSEQKPTSEVASIPVHGPEHASVVKFTGDRVAGYAESERQHVKSAADETGGSIDMYLTGVSPQGEKDSLLAATILITALNGRGASWGGATLADDPADCEASDPSGRKIWIQVVRATGSATVWQQLGAVGTAETSSRITDLVSELAAAIEKKSKRYAPAVKSKLVLALDANRVPGFVLDSVRETAIKQLQLLCRSSAFSSVWVVGPTAELSYALYEKA